MALRRRLGALRSRETFGPVLRMAAASAVAGAAGWLVLHEAMSTAQLLGAALVLVALVLGQVSRSSAPRRVGGHEPVPAPGSAIVSVPGLGSRQPELSEAGIEVSDRAGNLRAAFHLHNTAADVDRLLDALAG